MADFDKNLKQAKGLFVDEQDQEQIRAWEIEHKKSELWINLGEHPAFKELIILLEDTLIGLDVELNEQKVLTQDDIIKRLKLQTKKDLYEWFLGLFSSAKTKIQGIEKEVFENIKNGI